MKFCHTGAIGDIIYHLSVVKELGGGEFYILPADRDGYRTQNCMQYQSLHRLIRSQPYITKCEWSDTPIGINFDLWRSRLDFSKNLTDQAAQWLGMTPLDPLRPWLRVEPLTLSPVVFARSLQRNYHPAFNWKMLLDHYKDCKPIFLGLPHEYDAFSSEYGVDKKVIQYAGTEDLLMAARVIAGAKLYIGNATGLTAVAEGLKQKSIIASISWLDHCVYFNRPNVQHCWEHVEPMSLE